MEKVACWGQNSVKGSTDIFKQQQLQRNPFHQTKPHPRRGILIFQAQLQAVKLI